MISVSEYGWDGGGVVIGVDGSTAAMGKGSREGEETVKVGWLVESAAAEGSLGVSHLNPGETPSPASSAARMHFLGILA